MKPLKIIVLSFLLSSGISAPAQQLWTKSKLTSKMAKICTYAHTYELYNINYDLLERLSNNNSFTIELPTEDGSVHSFVVHQNQLLPEKLQAKYPYLKSFSGHQADKPSVSVRMELTDVGLTAMIKSEQTTLFIDPHTSKDQLYIVHKKEDENKLPEQNSICSTTGEPIYANKTTATTQVSNSGVLRKYRLALACNHQYAQTVTGIINPSKSFVLSKMMITINRVNEVYEKELAISMQFVENNDTLIFNREDADPISVYNSDPGTMLFMNQKYCDSLIGNDNYDIGHVFTTGAGGLSQVGCVCQATIKAQSVTGSSSPFNDGFDIDYVAHEIGHEFGSQHTFNNNINGSCGGNAFKDFAYEPGSGSTIMAYAGICQSDNLQTNSDAYFCASSLLQIESYLNTTWGKSCGTFIPTNMKAPAVESYTATYYIPTATPFELIAPKVTDSNTNGNTTYCWEEWDLGDFGKQLRNTDSFGPLFRSYAPTASPVRTFPKLSMILSQTNSNAGNDFAQGEKLPTVSRKMKFKLTVRSTQDTLGSFTFNNDSVTVYSQAGGPFRVTSQATSGITYVGGGQQKVTWDVANSTQSPINADSVDIYISTDDGATWAYNMGTFPNTGSAILTLPNPNVSTLNARFKVKGHKNVFFSVNKERFNLYNNPGTYGDIKVFPNPARNELTILSGDKGTISIVAINMLGQTVWKGDVDFLSVVDVSNWAKGNYILLMQDLNGQKWQRRQVID